MEAKLDEREALELVRDRINSILKEQGDLSEPTTVVVLSRAADLLQQTIAELKKRRG